MSVQRDRARERERERREDEVDEAKVLAVLFFSRYLAKTV